MAKDMLEAVYTVEEECKRRESDARAKADEIVENAKKEADKFICDTIRESNSKAEKLFEQAKLDSNSELKLAEENAEKQCTAISDLANKNRLNVIKKAVNCLTD